MMVSSEISRHHEISLEPRLAPTVEARGLWRMLAVLAVLAVVDSGDAAQMTKWTQRKRHTSSEQAEASLLSRLTENVEALTARLQRLTSPTLPSGGFLLSRGESEQQRAIDYMWRGDFSDVYVEMLQSAIRTWKSFSRSGRSIRTRHGPACSSTRRIRRSADARG
jgi:hypothetical protein